MFKFPRTRCLHLESMESRQLMAGNVFASVAGGYLVLSGDSASNGVEVRQVGAGQYRIIGLNTGGSPTNIVHGGVSAASHVVHGVAHGFNINMKEGNDDLFMNNAGLPAGQKLLVPGHLQVYMRDGDDTVYLHQVQVRNDAFIDLGSGNDSFLLYDSWVYGSSDSDLTVYGSNGIDYADVYRSYISDDMHMSMGDGADTVLMRYSLVGDEAALYTGHGADRVSLTCADFGDNLYVDTGDGNDTAALTDVVADEIDVHMGSDRDNLRVEQTRARRALFDGGSGARDDLDFGPGNSFDFLGTSNFEL